MEDPRGTVDQKDLERILEKRWKKYERGERRREIASCVFKFIIIEATTVARFLRKVGLAKQIRREKVSVE